MNDLTKLKQTSEKLSLTNRLKSLFQKKLPEKKEGILIGEIMNQTAESIKGVLETNETEKGFSEQEQKPSDSQTSSGTQTIITDAEEEDRVQKMLNDMPTFIIQKKVEQAIQQKIKHLTHQAKAITHNRSNFSAHALSEILIKIRFLKEILVNLANMAIEKLRSLFIEFVLGKNG